MATATQSLDEETFQILGEEIGWNIQLVSAEEEDKELLQQYTNCLKLLLNFVDDANTDEESPLRKWIAERGKKFVNKGEENMDTG